MIEIREVLMRQTDLADLLARMVRGEAIRLHHVPAGAVLLGQDEWLRKTYGRNGEQVLVCRYSMEIGDTPVTVDIGAGDDPKPTGASA